MSWFKELTSKAEAVLVKLDQNAAQALQNPTSILNDLTSSVSEPESSATSERYLDNQDTANQTLLPDTVIHTSSNPQQSQAKVQRFKHETSSNHSISDTSSSRGTSSRGTSQVTPGEIQVEAQVSKHVKRKTTVEENLEDSIKEEADTSRSSRRSKKFTIHTSQTKSNLFSEINVWDSNSLRRSENEEIKRNSDKKEIITLGADDIRASINQTLMEYSSNYLSTLRTNQSSNNHFDDEPRIINDEASCSSRKRNSGLSCSIDFSEDNCEIGQNTNITSRLLQQNMSKKKSTFNLHRVINKLANTHASEYMIFNDIKRVRFRRLKLRGATYVRKLNYYFQTHPNMKYYALVYVVLMQLLVVYVLFFYQSTPTPNDLSRQINKQLQDVEMTNVR